MPVFNVDTPIEIRWGKSTFSDYRSVHQLPIPQWHFAGGEFFRLGAAHRCSPQIQCNCKNLRKDGESRWRTRAFSSRRRFVSEGSSLCLPFVSEGSSLCLPFVSEGSSLCRPSLTS